MEIPSSNSNFDIEYTNYETRSGRRGRCFREVSKHRRDADMFEGPEIGGLGKILWIRWKTKGLVMTEERKHIKERNPWVMMYRVYAHKHTTAILHCRKGNNIAIGAGEIRRAASVAHI